jgi:hypothetical protein
MAQPDNQAALSALGRLLDAPIVPVRGAPAAIRRTLERYRPGRLRAEKSILAWCGSPERQAAVCAAAGYFAEALSAETTVLPPDVVELAAVLDLARQQAFDLTILSQPEPELLPGLLSAAGTPLLLVRGEQALPRSILIVLRGYSSDEYTVEWLSPLLRLKDTTATLLALTGPPELGITELLAVEGAAHDHLQHCLSLAAAANGETRLRARQGEPAEQIAAEIASGSYDLLVMAVESRGDFVGRVLAALDARGAHRGRLILVIKPLTRERNP